MGFLAEQGLGGAFEMATFVLVGTFIGIGLLYIFMFYKKEPTPRRERKITVKGHIVKIILLCIVIYFVLKI